MKKLIVSILVAVSSMASGATVAVGGAPASRLGVQAASGGALLVGTNSYFLTVGTYAAPPVSFASAIADFTPLRAVGTDAVVTVGSAATGSIGGTFVGVGPAGLSSAPIFVFVANNADYALATEIAVLRASTQVFPNPVSGSGSVTVTSSITGLVGVLGQVTDAPTGSFDFVTMVAVPEPSTALLGLLGVAGLIRRRR
jgi:hypothetical protein